MVSLAIEQKCIFRLGICFLVLLALAIWYCKCRDRNRERQEEILTRQRMLIEQLRQEESATQPSRYHPDAPPAYDDVINKPEDYPIYEGKRNSRFYFVSCLSLFLNLNY